MNQSFSLKEHKISFIFAILSSLVVIFQTNRFWYLPDLSFVLEHSYKILHGIVIYKDFIFPYPPGTFIIQALVIKIFGTTLYPQIIYCSLVSFFTYLLTYRILYFFNNDKLLNVILAFPVVFTGGYGLLSFPFYDPDSVLFILISIYFIFCAIEKGFPAIVTFLGGFFTVFPAFFKQNTGLAFFALINISFIIVLVYKKEEINLKSYLVFLFGALIASAGWIIYIQLTSGIANYYYSIITIPGQVRLPTPTRFFKEYLNFRVFKDVLLCIPVFLVLYFIESKNRWVNYFVYLLALLPFYIIPLTEYILFHREYYDSFLEIWIVTIIFASVAGIYSLLKIKDINLYTKIFIFVLIGLLNAAFLSQGYNSSTYSLWPILSILLGMLYLISAHGKFKFHTAQFKRIFTLNSLAITISVVVLVVSNFHWHMVFYLSGEGELHRSTNAALKGLVAPGDFIPNLDNLLVFVKNEIPPDDGIINIPHEDPFFFATGRIPQVPIYINEWSLTIYTPEEIVDMIRTHGVKWIIVKTRLQMGNSDNRNIDTILSMLKKDYSPYKSIPGYEIYKLAN